MLPLARPSLAVLAVFTFISYWNSFIWPLVVINDVPKLATVPLRPAAVLQLKELRWHLVHGGVDVSMAPTVVVLILLQRHLVRGIVTSGFGGADRYPGDS